MWLFCPLFLNGSTFQAQWSAKPKSQPDNARPTHLISTLPSLFSDILLQFSSVTQSCPTLCDPMNHSRPGFPVHHQLPGFTQTHAHWVGDAIQPSHPLSFPSPPIFNLSQHQGFFFFFKWVSASHKVAKVFEFQLQHQSFQWTLRTDFLPDFLIFYLTQMKSCAVLFKIICVVTLQLTQNAFFSSHLLQSSGSQI